jgi:hypothetical protein
LCSWVKIPMLKDAASGAGLVASGLSIDRPSSIRGEAQSAIADPFSPVVLVLRTHTY